MYDNFSRSRALEHPPSHRVVWITAGVLLMGSAGLSTGFVHRSLLHRRSRAKQQERALEHEAIWARFARRVRTWRSHRQRRRHRGGGWDRGRSIELLSQHYAFGASGQQTSRRLSSSVIHRVMRTHNDAITSLAHLRRLHLDKTRVDSAGLRHVGDLLQLRELVLEDTRVGATWD